MAKPHSPGRHEEQLVSAPSPANDFHSQHHIWKSPNGSWCVSLTFYNEAHQRKRMICSLGTSDLHAARQRRDDLLDQLIQCGAPIALRAQRP